MGISRRKIIGMMTPSAIISLFIGNKPLAGHDKKPLFESNEKNKIKSDDLKNNNPELNNIVNSIIQSFAPRFISVGMKVDNQKYVLINDRVYNCTPALNGLIKEVNERYIKTTEGESYLSDILRHIGMPKNNFIWKIELTIEEKDILDDILKDYKYQSMGFQSFYIDDMDFVLYIAWQTIHPNEVWVTVHNWIDGALITRIHLPLNAGAPEGIRIYRKNEQRFLIVPFGRNQTLRMYKIDNPLKIIDKTKIEDFLESKPLGMRYQFSSWGDFILYENVSSGWKMIDGKSVGTSNIFNYLNVNSVINGDTTVIGSLTLDSSVIGRSSIGAKRQGIALGSQRIYTSAGKSTLAAEKWKFNGLQGYNEYSLSGGLLGSYLVSPSALKPLWEMHTGKLIYSTENEGIQSSTISGIEEQYILQSMRYQVSGKNIRSLNIIRVNCPVLEPNTLNLTTISTPVSNSFMPRSNKVNIGYFPSMESLIENGISSLQGILNYLDNTELSSFSIFLSKSLPILNKSDERFVLEKGGQIEINYINDNIWKVEVDYGEGKKGYKKWVERNDEYTSLKSFLDL